MVVGSMGENRSNVGWLNLESLVALLLLLYILSTSDAITNPADVVAINNLYVSLGSPILPLWVASGGDPCGESWQGVTCDVSNNIISITISAANLEGELGENIGDFSSIQTILLSNNHIGGRIPTNLPKTLVNLFLSSNEFTGSIPDSLSSLTGLQAMSLNDNHLTGEIPDAFQSLQNLVNLDMSTNNLSGQLPPSVGNLSNIRTIHLQNNQLSGTLDVLQDLPLSNLNIENNQFSGPIPDKLFSLPTFKKDGNPFNSTIAPSPLPSSSTSPPTPPFFGAGPSTSVQAPPGSGQTPPGSGRTPPGQTRGKQAEGPSTTEDSSSKSSKKSSGPKKIVLITIVSVVSVIILILAILLCLPKCLTRRPERHRVSKRHEIAPYKGDRQNPRTNASSAQPSHLEEKAPPVKVERPKEEHQQGPRRTSLPSKPPNEEANVHKLSAIPKKHDHEIDLSRFEIDLMVPPPPPPPPPQTPPPPPPPPQTPPPPPPILPEKVTVEPTGPTEVSMLNSSTGPLPPTSVKSFSIASLQLYTNSFSQDNLLGAGMLGNVYRADLPSGKFLAVKKLDKRVSNQQKDDEFLEMVNNLDKIRHANVVELMGYCAEHGQRLLIYEYCSNGTLQDALHSDDEFKKNLSWNTRIRMALGAARALEYLHEVCDPPMIHRNFKSANILLDDDLSVYVSDCGLAPLISSGAVSQLSGQLLTTYGYGAPEFDSGIYTSKSDVYSFGVVMLELLTGRMSHDRSRIRGEQFLVRWAIPQLHDIDALSSMVDPPLSGKYPVKSLSHFADIISRCVQPEPEFRPPMSEVVQDLIEMIRRESSTRSDGD